MGMRRETAVEPIAVVEGAARGTGHLTAKSTNSDELRRAGQDGNAPSGAYERLAEEEPELLAEIERRNAHGMAVYREAVAIFDRRLELAEALNGAFPA